MLKLAESGEDGYKRFRTAKKHMEAVDDIEWHHLVEQSQIKRNGFSAICINNPNNLVGIDRGLHQKISAFYSGKPTFLKVEDQLKYSTVRDWVSTLGFEQQYTFGIIALQRFKNL